MKPFPRKHAVSQHRFVALATLLACAATGRAQHQGDIWIGITSSGQLGVSTNGYVPYENYAPLSPASGLINGWTDDDPGFDHVTAPQDVSPLASGAAIWLEVVELDPAFRAIDDGFQFLDTPGDDTLLGGSTVHEHITWHIDSDDAAFDPEQCVWRATFVLRDDGSTAYETSLPFTIYFANIAVRNEGVPATGDFDDSGLLDDIDFTALSACLDGGGPQHVPEPDAPGVTTCEVECLNAFDFDDDRDVDLRDAAAFQRLF